MFSQQLTDRKVHTTCLASRTIKLAKQSHVGGDREALADILPSTTFCEFLLSIQPLNQLADHQVIRHAFRKLSVKLDIDTDSQMDQNRQGEKLYSACTFCRTNARRSRLTTAVYAKILKSIFSFSAKCAKKPDFLASILKETKSLKPSFQIFFIL